MAERKPYFYTSHGRQHTTYIKDSLFADDVDPNVDNVYLNPKRALDAHFNPKRNTEFEVYTFRKATQLRNESLDAYYARLRTLAKNCDFDNADAEIKSHVI